MNATKIFDETAVEFGPVRVGYGFECEKHNGKKYGGTISKVSAHPKGTLVTIEFADNDGPCYRSIYLEDCKVWYAGTLTPRW